MFRKYKNSIFFTLSCKLHLKNNNGIGKSNNTPLQTPLNIEKEIFMPQGEPEMCLLCNEPELLFEPNRANLEPITILTCFYSFHLRCIIIFLKKDTTCPQCQQPIYLKDDNNTQIHLKKEEYIVEKLFKYLAKEPQDFGPSSKNMVIETENSTSSEIVFVKIHNKIIQAEKILEEKTYEVSCAKYEVLDSYYLLGKALVKKLADFLTNHPLTARTLLNVEIKRQFPFDMSHNVFNKKKRSTINIYKIFSTEGLGKDNIKRIRKFTPSAFGRFNDKEMKVIQERVRTTFSQPNKLENQLDNLDLNEERDPMLTD
ncbi:19304_t:CDS:1 [Dentiscutata erythropus]|uniref:19304_t:CDS:1 n=1 Tax=Dentiscutata erythropus TaxID=1348616 RepID=A0A9N9P290_9GLOM|nr:19304_t:CDS:1 [Dentiscutata erythropus]